MLRWEKNKYNNKKSNYKGVVYDSKKEMEYAQMLDEKLAAKKIKGWTRQVNFPLPDINWLEKGSTRSRYCADFIVAGLDGREHIVEVKGLYTPEMKVKYSFVQYVYKRPVHVVPTTGINSMHFDYLDESCKCPNINEGYINV